MKRFTNVVSIILAFAIMTSAFTFVASAETVTLMDSGVITFNDGTIPSCITKYWPSVNYVVVADPKPGVSNNKVLAVSQTKVIDGSSASNVTAAQMDFSSWETSTDKKGVLTYEFDYFLDGVSYVAVKIKDADGYTVINLKPDKYEYRNDSWGLSEETTGINIGGWNTIKLSFDFQNKMMITQANDGPEHKVAFPTLDMSVYANFTNQFKVALRASVTSSAKYFYVDNIRVTYAVETPEINETGNGIKHSWLEGIKILFDIEMDKTSVETAGNIKLLKTGSTDTEVLATVKLDNDNKTVTLIPTEPINPDASYKVLITTNVKGKNNVFVRENIETPLTLEALADVAVVDDDIELFDKNGTELISKVKFIKVAFNVPMDKVSLEDEGNITLVKEDENTSIDLTAEYDINNDNAVILTLNEELDSYSEYILTFGTNVKRIDGTTLPEAIVKVIKTPVLEKPAIIAENVTYVDKSGEAGRMNSLKKKIVEIKVPFSVSIDSATVDTENISLVKLTDGGENSVTLNMPSLDDEKTVVITPSMPLDAQCDYKIIFDENFKAINGETIENGENMFIFETAVLDSPKVTSVTASANGLNFANVASVADISTVKAELNYALNPSTVSSDTVKLEKYVLGNWIDAGAVFAFDGDKCMTWTMPDGLTFPEGVEFRISFSDMVEDIYGDEPAEDYEIKFVTKQSAAAVSLKGLISGKNLTYSGTLMSGNEPVSNEKMAVLVYKQGGALIPFGVGTKHFDIITTGNDGSFEGSIVLYDDESSPRFEELWIAFDAQSMGKSNQRDARVAVQYTNALMDNASLADLKRSQKSVFNYITEAADSEEIKAIVPLNGLTAIQNKKLYEGMGVWVNKYTAMDDAEKATVNATLQDFKTQLTIENVPEILNASLIAAEFGSLTTDEAVADLITYNDDIVNIKVEETDFNKLLAESQAWVAENVKTNNPSGYADYKMFIKEVRKGMLLDMISSTTYTELADLFINNKELINDGLTENKLSELESEKSQKITDEAMRTIKLSNERSKFKTTEDLAEAIEDAVQNAKKSGSQGGGSGSSGGSGGSGGSGSSRNDSFSIGTEATNTSQSEKEEILGNVDAITNEVFMDLSNYKWAESAILNLYNKGIVSGVGDGLFEPDRAVTREEFLKMVCEAFELDIVDEPSGFMDVALNEWYTKYVVSAVKSGIVKGVSETHFGTGDLISREDMAVMIYRALVVKEREVLTDRRKFVDSDKIAPYALEAVETLGSLGIISGVGDGAFVPENKATRAEAAVIISRCLQ